MLCPWCRRWRGEASEFVAHLDECPSFPGLEAVKEKKKVPKLLVEKPEAPPPVEEAGEPEQKR